MTQTTFKCINRHRHHHVNDVIVVHQEIQQEIVPNPLLLIVPEAPNADPVPLQSIGIVNIITVTETEIGRSEARTTNKETDIVIVVLLHTVAMTTIAIETDRAKMPAGTPISDGMIMAMITGQQSLGVEIILITPPLTLEGNGNLIWNLSPSHLIKDQSKRM